MTYTPNLAWVLLATSTILAPTATGLTIPTGTAKIDVQALGCDASYSLDSGATWIPHPVGTSVQFGPADFAGLQVLSPTGTLRASFFRVVF